MANFVVEIDPREKSISKVLYNTESVSLSDMYSSLECDMVERVSIGADLDLWIDEEGQLNGAADRIGIFNIGEWQFVGKGLICAFTDVGDTIPFSEETADFIVDNLIIEF
jgi:hypothetical protein